MVRYWGVLWLLATTSGCAWFGFKNNPPAESSWQTPSAGGGTPITTYFYQPDSRRTQAIKEALAEVHAIYQDEDFRDRVREFDGWLTRATRCGPQKSEFKVSGATVVSTVLDGGFEKVHYLVNMNTSAIATTGIGSWNRTSINPYQVDKWWSHGRLELKAELINTVAHELTHLVRLSLECEDSGGGASNCGFTQRYQDKDHDSCTETYLVSCRLGDMAACYYRLKHQPTTDFEQCMAKIRERNDGDACVESRQAIAKSCQRGG